MFLFQKNFRTTGIGDVFISKDHWAALESRQTGPTGPTRATFGPTRPSRPRKDTCPSKCQTQPVFPALIVILNHLPEQCFHHLPKFILNF